MLYMKTQDIKVAPFNPEIRTLESKLDELVLSMKQNGFYDFMPVLIGSDGFLGDGHRRLAAAKKVGIESIPVIVVKDKTSSEIWAANLTGRRNAGAADWGQARVKGMNILPLTHSVRHRIKQVEEYGLLEYLAERRVSFNIMTIALRAAEYISREPTKEFICALVRWMVETKSTRFTQDAMSFDITPDLIIHCFESNKPLRPYQQKPE